MRKTKEKVIGFCEREYARVAVNSEMTNDKAEWKDKIASTLNKIGIRAGR